MATKAINTLAKRGLEIKIEMEKLANELAGINAKLVKNEGTAIELDLGLVTITRTTEARPSGTYDLIFDKVRFLELPEDDAARESAMASGIIKLKPGITSGRAAVVQYRLSNK